MMVTRMAWLTCSMMKEEEFNLHRRKENGIDVRGVLPMLRLLPIHWDSCGGRKRAPGAEPGLN